MQCPVCKKHTMDAVDLLPDLPGFVCSECTGVWINGTAYDIWHAKQPGNLPENTTAAAVAVTDTHKAKICPQCGHLLLPYRVGNGLSFSIDYCSACSGTWLDHGEWDALKARNLHGSLRDIVATSWQAAVRRADAQDGIEQTCKRLLGADYDKAVGVRAWVREHPQRSLILAYLGDIKPEPK